MIIGEEECGMAVAAKEGDKMLVTPTQISSYAPVGMAKFTAWDVQGNVISACIQEVYASLYSTTVDNE